MRVLVSWGTKLGGTEGIARIIQDVLERGGFDVVARHASAVTNVSGFDAAVVGGALYANRWHRDARRLVGRNIAGLRRIPVWLFSSGPLDDSADQKDIAPVTEVAVLMERIGARGHTTFGGRLPADAKGFPAAAMAKKHSGDWRNPDRIRAWGTKLSRELPSARPNLAIDPPARRIRRLAAHGIAGWALCAAVMGGLLQTAPVGLAIAVHAVVAPIIFTALAVHYFRAWGAREPLPTAIAWTAIVAALDATVVAGLVLGDFGMFMSVSGTWLPFGLIFVATWATGLVRCMMPSPTATKVGLGVYAAGRSGEGHRRTSGTTERHPDSSANGNSRTGSNQPGASCHPNRPP